jgi:hypothetical protein
MKHAAEVDFQHATRRYIPEDRTLHNHRCENLKSYNSLSLCFIPSPILPKTLLLIHMIYSLFPYLK